MLLVQNECTTAGVPRSLKVMERWLRLMAHLPRAANQAEQIYSVTVHRRGRRLHHELRRGDERDVKSGCSYSS